MPSDSTSAPTLPGHAHDVPLRDVVLGVSFLAATLTQASVRYFRLLVGSVDPHPDAALVWRPVAKAVLDGAPLYVEPATDNKPPLFEFLNVLLATTDAYQFAFLSCVALANGLSAVLLYRLFARSSMRTTGAVAAGAFLLALPLVKGHAINVRSFAVCAFFVALTLRRPGLRGAAAAASILFSQYLVFGVPVVVWYGLHRRQQRRSVRTWFVRFAVAGGSLVLVTYGAVLVLWGVPSFVGSVYWSTGLAQNYFTAYGPSVWVGVRAWRVYTLELVTRLSPLLLLSAGGAAAVLARCVPPSKRDGERRALQRLVLGSACLFGAFLFVRPYDTYWLYSLPWVAALAAFGLRTAADAVGPSPQ
ncbi:hypothetical protein SAMN04488063_3288 [Halopelagius inordinatus]|uniref:Dolichyl-phosphate-mannose-protein mannosyltransferase n=1 Tax=Halopelagius inordinatus TaxID=553467 RepID=A0A1I2VR05_9EURY|nr:hypothetical protein [Halopelagius inordinatus]SFG91668.1 hypothetical protein SAMN04488063_3288 [Halopelagius inordinatus]